MFKPFREHWSESSSSIERVFYCLGGEWGLRHKYESPRTGDHAEIGTNSFNESTRQFFYFLISMGVGGLSTTNLFNKMNYPEVQKRNSLYRLELKKRATKQELVFKKHLNDNKIKHIFQKGFLKPFHRIVDFYIKKYRLIVEIDGGYHKDLVAKDQHKDRVWKELGFSTLRISNEDVDNGDFIYQLSTCTKRP